MGRVGSAARRKCSGSRRRRRWRRRLCLCHPSIAWTFRLDDSIFLLCRVLVTGCGGEGGGGGRRGRSLRWCLLLWRFWRRPWLLGSGAQARSSILMTTSVMEEGGGEVKEEGGKRDRGEERSERRKINRKEGDEGERKDAE